MMLNAQTPGRPGGTVLPLMVVCLIPLLALVAFAIDMGYIVEVRTELQLAADSAAQAGASTLPNQTDVTSVAQRYANYNHAGTGTILPASDVVVGVWNDTNRTFTAGGSSPNAVKATVRRTRANSNAVDLYFARAMGITQADVTAEAIAVRPPNIGGRFILDDEMFDTDEPAIDALKSQYPNTPVDSFLSDGNRDFFIDLYDFLPANDKQILVRTGQVGDEAMFDITTNVGSGLPQFPFNTTSNPSFTDFLKFNKSGSPVPWVYNSPAENLMIPELKGVGRFNDSTKFNALVNPDFTHVSPVYKSDVNSSDSVGSPAQKGVAGAKDERRGLVAFKIVGVQNDPRGGSYLPNLRIEIVNPSTVNLNAVQPYSSYITGKVRLVR